MINSQLAPVFKVHLWLLPAVGNICFMNTHTSSCWCSNKYTHTSCGTCTRTHRQLQSFCWVGVRHLLFVVHKLLIAVNRKLRGKQAFLMLMKFSRPVSPFKPTLCYQVGWHDNKRRSFNMLFPYQGECRGVTETKKFTGKRPETGEALFFKLFVFENLMKMNVKLCCCYKWQCELS